MIDKQIISNKFKGKVGQLAVLIDPEKAQDEEKLIDFLKMISRSFAAYIFVGGSTGTRLELDFTVNVIKKYSALPIILFPGSPAQISNRADALLYLTLISGRNADFLIGHHVKSASELWNLDIEKIPTSYLLLDGGIKTSVEKVSNTLPIDAQDFDTVHATIKAGLMLGQQLIYLDGGSGAKHILRKEIIEEVKKYTEVPVLIGGGISTKIQFDSIAEAGANVIIMGNIFESNPKLILEFI